ncbi:MAG: amphi-Trp domain-containing protein [Proteobacteria bacterium]|nr:amphi-Trp domain-containing protein [Pseudomonadota bacterium]
MKPTDAAKAAKDKSAELITKAKEKADEMLFEEKFVMESLEDATRVTDYLRGVIDGIEQGRVTLTSEDREMVLYPSSLLKFSVKGSRRSNKSKLSFKLSWSRLEDDQDA